LLQHTALQVDVKEWAKYMRADLESYHITYDLPPPTFPVVPLEDNFMAQAVVNNQQLTATCCNALQRTVALCNALQCTATHGNARQRTATRCNTLPVVPLEDNFMAQPGVNLRNSQQLTATHCNSLQRAASHCISLQLSATHFLLYRQRTSSWRNPW